MVICLRDNDNVLKELMDGQVIPYPVPSMQELKLRNYLMMLIQYHVDHHELG